MSERSFTNTSNQNLAGFVPALVIDYLLEKLRKKETRKLPEKQTFDSVIMFADISGFTNLAEKLSKKGPEGTELLAFTLNRYMELLVNGISRSGGDIFKFAGDAMIIVWPPPPNNDPEELTILCRQAIQSALDIQSKLTDFKIIDDVKLSVKIGFGVGQVTIAHVGGVFQRAEYLPAGSPLTQAFECEHLAPCGGVVICSKYIWERCANFFEFEQINKLEHYKGENAPFFYVKKVKKSVKMKADAFLIKNKFKPGDIEAIRNSLKSYIPAAIIPFIEIDQEKWSAELRRLSVLFVNLGIDLKDAQSQPGLERIQQVIECVQRCVYSNQGSLNKFLMDDKGSTLIVVFGLYPMAHQDDPVRAVLTAMNLVNELKPIKCPCSIGVTTGMVFAGVVGTSGNRREYSVLGDSVNLSARLMQAACQEKEKKVLVCETTKLEAEHKLKFRFFKKTFVKGKSGEIPFFEPVDEEIEDDGRASRDTKFHSINIDKIKIHVVSGWENKKLFGASYENNAFQAINLIEKFINKPSRNGLVMITGSYGAGKSLMVTEIIEKTSKILENFTWKNNEKIQVYASSLNSLEKGKKFNGWRKIMQEILIRLSLRMKQNSESLLIKLLEKNEEIVEHLYLVQDILNIKMKIPQPTKNKFVQRAQEIFEKKVIKKILLKILVKYLEEDEKVVDNSFEDTMKNSISMLSMNTDISKKKKNDNMSVTAPLIIILDDMQDYDLISWEFTFKVLRRLKKVFILVCIRNKFIELPPVFKKQEAPNNKQNTSESSTNSVRRKTTITQKNIMNENNNQEEIVESGLYELEEICENSFFLRIDIKGLDKNEIEGFLSKFLNFKTIKHDYDCKLYIEKFFKFLMDKTEGIPLSLLHLSEKILSNDFGVMNHEDKSLFLTKKLYQMIEMNEFLTLETPLCNMKVNNPIIDKLSSAHLLVVKSAAVIGDIFDIQTLLKLNPFKSSIPSERLRAIINDLERQDFIEILDDQSNNIRYRFELPFMREVIYQRIIYNHRRVIHRYVAEAIQAIPLTLPTAGEEKVESDRLIYHWCLAENKDPFPDLKKNNGLNEDFSNKAKRSIIVKKISSLLSKNPNNLNVIIKKGNLDKKSDRGFKWSCRYCIMNTREFKYYYTEEDYTNSLVDEPLGTIPFKNIFQIMPLNEKESKGKLHAFVIYVGSWQKKDKEMGIREFYFSAYSNDELEQWTTYMEFIRAKAIYDAFVNTFGKISFPLTNNALEKIESLDESTKFGQGMSRMAFMTQKMSSNQNFLSNYNKSHGSFRKTTFKTGGLRDKGKNKEVAFNEFRESNTNENIYSNYNAECQKKLKERIIHFFQSSHFLFWSHVFEMSSRNMRKEARNDNMILGNNTHFMKEKNHHFFFERTLFDDVPPPQSYLDKRVSKYHTSFSINGRSSSFMYGSSDSLDDLNNVTPQTPEKIVHKNSGFLPLRTLTSVDENLSEEITSPQVKFQKAIVLKPDEKPLSNNLMKVDGDSNVKEREEYKQNDLLEKIEEVNESVAVVTEPDFMKGSQDTVSFNDKSIRRKSKFNLISLNENKNYEETSQIDRVSSGSRASEISSLRNVPVLSMKSQEHHYHYIEDKQKDDYEIVFKTKKSNFPSYNENYGELFKNYNKNQITFNSIQDRKNGKEENTANSLQNIQNENDDEDSMKELLRSSIKKIIEIEDKKTSQKNPISEKSLNNISKSTSNNVSLKNEEKRLSHWEEKNNTKQLPLNMQNCNETKETSWDRWENENPIIANEEGLYKKPEMFSEKDFGFLNFPHNLNENKKTTEIFNFPSKNYQKNDEEIILKKKLKDYSHYKKNYQKDNLSDEDKMFFKDYETLIQAKKWDSKKDFKTNSNSNEYSSQKQETLFNLNYKSVKNFQSKNFH